MQPTHALFTVAHLRLSLSITKPSLTLSTDSNHKQNEMTEHFSLQREQLQEDLLTLLEELDDDIKVVICKLVCETFDKLSPESISEEVR